MDGAPSWPWRWRRQLFEWEKDLVKDLKWSIEQTMLNENVRNKWIWEGNPLGSYIVRYVYRSLISNADAQHQHIHKLMWQK